MAAVLLGAPLGACVVVGPEFRPPQAHVTQDWLTSDESAQAARPTELANWWLRFHDPVLTHLVELGVRNNPTLQLAGERVLQAQAQLAQALGERFPQEQVLTGSFDNERQSVHSAGFVPGAPANLNVAQIALTANWELDFWGKYKRAIQSQRAGLAENQFAYQAALVTLTAQIASAYVTIRTDEAEIVVAQENISSQREGLRLAKARFDAGENSELDLRQAQSQVAETESQIYSLQSNRRQARDSLAIPLGLSPAEVDAQLGGSGPIPTIDPNIGVGAPRDLLRQRADVREAEEAAAAQSAQIGVAKAALYPSFSLGGSFGFAASDVGHSSLSDLFRWDSRMAQIGPSFTFPIFNYGRLQAEVNVQSALFRQAVLNYQTLVLQAQQEVEDARASLTYTVRSADKLSESVSAARRGTQLALIQYREGETDYTTVLNAQQSLLRVENQLAQARGATPLAAVSLYKALGGGWRDPSPAPVQASQEEPKP